MPIPDQQAVEPRRVADGADDCWEEQAELVTRLLQYSRVTKRNGALLSRDPLLQHLLVEAYIDCEVGRLLAARNSRMRTAEEETTYEAAQHRLWVRRASLRLAEIVREVLGPYALLTAGDPRAPFGGKFAEHQKRSLEAEFDGWAAAMADSLQLRVAQGQPGSPVARAIWQGEKHGPLVERTAGHAPNGCD